jgi:hypothetical protein
MTEEKALTRNRSIGYFVPAATSDRDAASESFRGLDDLIADFVVEEC